MSVIKSMKFIFVGNIFSKGIAFIGSLALAYLLFPDDYGYLLKVSIITAFIQMFGNMGFENFYLQEKISSETQREKILNITAKLRFIINGALFLIQFLVSYAVDYYSKSPTLGKMLRIFSFVILINGVTQINMFILRKELNYKPETYANISRDISGTIFKILFAWLGFGALSFAYGALIGNFFRMLVFLKYKFYIPNLKDIDRNVFNKVLHFGKHSLLLGIVSYFNNQIDKLFLSTFFTNKQAGLYSFSNQFSSMPYNYIALPFSSLILSYSANRKDNPNMLFKKLIDITEALTIILFPIFLILYFFSNELFFIAFEDKWNSAIPVFKILLIYYFFIIPLSLAFSGLITAFGKPEILSKISIVRLVIVSLSLYYIVSFSDSIIYYVSVFTLFGIIFSWIKTSIGLNLLNKTLFDLIKSIKFLLFQIFIIFVFLSLIEIYSDLNFGLIIFICISFFYLLNIRQLVFLKKTFFTK